MRAGVCQSSYSRYCPLHVQFWYGIFVPIGNEHGDFDGSSREYYRQMEENRERFLAVSAAHFKDVYLQHILRFKFDADGACMLLRDVSAFRGVFRKAAAGPHALQAVDDAFDVLHEVANAFALPPENVGGFVRDGKLAALGRSTLLELVKRRVDYRANADKITLS